MKDKEQKIKEIEIDKLREYDLAGVIVRINFRLNRLEKKVNEIIKVINTIKK
jgi:hypothetical protein